MYQDENTGTAGVDRAARTQNQMADLEYVESLKEYNKKQTTLDTNIERAYSLVWGQCTPAMQAQIKTQSDFQTIRDNFDVFALLKAIKGHTFKLTDRDYPYQPVWDSYMSVFHMKQGKDEYLDKFQERFNVQV